MSSDFLPNPIRVVSSKTRADGRRLVRTQRARLFHSAVGNIPVEKDLLGHFLRDKKKATPPTQKHHRDDRDSNS